MTADLFGQRPGGASPTYAESPMTPALIDTARAARVRVGSVNNATVSVYSLDGNESVGRLHRNPTGWRAVLDATGDSSAACASSADALAALLRMDVDARIAAHPAGGGR